MLPRITLAIGLVAFIAGCAAQDQPPVAPAIFAYTTYIARQSQYAPQPDGDFGIVRDGKPIAHIPGQWVRSEAFFTEDGQHVVARRRGTEPGLNLVVYDVRGGQNRMPSITIPVESDARPGGAGTVVWIERTNRLMQADLSQSDPKPEQLRTLALPPVERPQDVYIKAEQAGRLFITRHEQPWQPPVGGPETLYVMARDGQIRSYGQEAGIAGIAHASFAPDHKHLAYTTTKYAPPRTAGDVNSCFHTSVSVLDLDSGQAETADVEGHPDDDMQSYTHAVWWGMDGSLHASSYIGHCESGGQLTTVRSYREFVRSGSTWSMVGDEPVLQSRELAGGAKALLLATGEPSDEIGTLYYVTSNGQRTQIADNAIAFATPQPVSASTR